ncbi:MAG: cellulose binding domain-containing protein, partial [Verrucomicrobiota bacterium]
PAPDPDPTPEPDPTPDPDPAPGPSGGVDVDFVVGDNWGSGYVANVTITNGTDSAINGWTVSFALDSNITQFWSATGGTVSGNVYTFSNESWNGSIAPGSSVSFGLQTNSSADLTADNITFNGQSAGGGSTPAPDPEPDPQPAPDPDPTPAPDPAPSGGDLAISVDNAWNSGFTASASITVDQALDGWELSFDFPYGISSAWDARVVSVVGNRVTLRNASYNARVPAGGTITFGFNAGSGGPSTGDILTPTNVTLSGQ